MKQIKQINELRGHISEMSKNNFSMIKSFGDTLSFLNTLGQQFNNLRADATKLKLVNQQLNEEFQSFSMAHKRKVAASS